MNNETKLEAGDWIYLSDLEKYFKVIQVFNNGSCYIFLNKKITTITKEEIEHYVTCSFKPGEMVEILYSGKTSYDPKIIREFYKFDPNLDKPYLVIDDFGDIENVINCKKIVEYIPYDIPSLDWLGKIVNYDNQDYELTGISKANNKYYVVLENKSCRWNLKLDTFVKECTWKDTGKPCGKEIKNE